MAGHSNLPSLTQVQELFFELICTGASAMARDKIVSAIIAAFGDQLGGESGALAKYLGPNSQGSVRRNGHNPRAISGPTPRRHH